MLQFFQSALVLAGMSPFLQTGFSMPWWGWLLLFLVIVLIVFLLIRSSDKKEKALDVEYEKETDPLASYEGDLLPYENEQIKEVFPAPSRTGIVSEDEAPATVSPTDDLTIIEGIGPKINDFLHRSGITTFRQLADMNMDELDKKLSEANFEIADPETWAEQAELAAKGEWENLKTLQDSLKGGRRIA